MILNDMLIHVCLYEHDMYIDHIYIYGNRHPYDLPFTFVLQTFLHISNILNTLNISNISEISNISNIPNISNISKFNIPNISNIQIYFKYFKLSNI